MTMDRVLVLIAILLAFVHVMGGLLQTMIPKGISWQLLWVAHQHGPMAFMTPSCGPDDVRTVGMPAHRLQNLLFVGAARVPEGASLGHNS